MKKPSMRSRAWKANDQRLLSFAMLIPAFQCPDQNVRLIEAYGLATRKLEEALYRPKYRNWKDNRSRSDTSFVIRQVIGLPVQPFGQSRTV